MTAVSTNINTFETASRLYYYGARYYNPKTSIRLGVDPMSDKYPGLSPYSYTLNNPIRLNDPNGMEAWESGDLENPPPSGFTSTTKLLPVLENSKVGGAYLIQGVEVIDKEPTNSSNRANAVASIVLKELPKLIASELLEAAEAFLTTFGRFIPLIFLSDDIPQNKDNMVEHKSNKRPSTKGKRYEDQARMAQNRNGSKGEKLLPRIRTPEWKCPWPPQN